MARHRASSFDLDALRSSVLQAFERVERALEERTARLNHEREALRAKAAELARKRQELSTLRGELEAQQAAVIQASYGIFAACCYSPITEKGLEVEARKERRQQVMAFAKEAFEVAGNDEKELTLEDLRAIEGDNAEQVMMEADVDGSGTLSKREYVNYKIHVAKQAGREARKAFRTADLNNEKELTLEELRQIEGDNAERVMREADVDGSGRLSKREYVDYKIRVASTGFAMHR